MSVKEDQIDSANVGGLNALVFDEENHERRSWKFFNSRLPRSEVVYFTQILIILFLIVVSLTKLVFSQLDCEESTFCFHCFRAQLATLFQIQSYEQNNIH